MLHEVVMPKLAMGMNEGTVLEWKVPQQGRIEKGQILLEIETEKVTTEIEALETGFVNILTPPGETVPTYHPIAQIADAVDEFSVAGAGAKPVPAAEAAVPPAPSAASPAGQSGRIVVSPAAKKLAKEHGVELAQVAGTGPNGKIDKDDVQAFIASETLPETAAQGAKASPLARKLAQEHGIDLGQVAGTGPGGKVGKEDVLAAVERQAAKPAAAGPQAASEGSEPGVRATLPMRGLRGAIAANMMKSMTTTAQLTATIEYDATELVKFRKALLEQEEEIGLRVSYLDLMTLIVGRAATRIPIVNASIVGEEIKVWEQVNVGIAVATEINEFEYGLFVPVVQDAGRQPLAGICRDIRRLTDQVRAGKLTPDLMAGGTITLSSGSMGSGMVMATPVLTPGQAMLVQPGMIEERPVVRDGAIVIRPVLRVNYTFDHRIVDGVPFAKFSETVKRLVECPARLIL